jgi:hypothetical protein
VAFRRLERFDHEGDTFGGGREEGDIGPHLIDRGSPPRP